MKEKRARLNTKKKLENDKLALKQEKLRQIDEENEKQRKNIIKKIKKMEKKKLELDKQKDERFQQKKEEMGMKFQDTIDNKNTLSKEADAKREEVLEYESYIFNIVKEKEANNISKRAQSQSRTIQNQKDDQNKMRQFKRIIYSFFQMSPISSSLFSSSFLFSSKSFLTFSLYIFLFCLSFLLLTDTSCNEFIIF